ncbi:MAG: Sbal_3080 family lipoprotein [Oligoflexales bacterium]
MTEPKNIFFLLSLILASLAACTTIDVKELNKGSHKISEICIEMNEKVIVTDFLPVIEKALALREIKSRVYKGEIPQDCEYTLHYVALRKWDLSPFLSEADIRIHRKGELIASGHYEIDNGLNFDKYEGTETKMTPVFQKIFQDNIGCQQSAREMHNGPSAGKAEPCGT